MSAESLQELQVGDDLYVMILTIADLKEADVNAQVLQPRHFDRLTSNIRNRGQITSLPYVSWPNREGPKRICSGHHRARAARNAGLTQIPCLVDTRPMTTSEFTAQQIAHNELHGTPDTNVLAQLVRMINDVDDLLATGLDEKTLNKLGDVQATALGTPHAAFDWRVFTCLFLPHQMEALKDALDTIDKKSEVIGIAPRGDFEEFARQVIEYGRMANIRSAGAAVSALIAIARREIDQADEDGVQPDSPWVRTAELFGPAVPPEAAQVIRRAVATCLADGDIPEDQKWRAAEFIAADFLGRPDAS
jgi:hypothetical protein